MKKPHVFYFLTGPLFMLLACVSNPSLPQGAVVVENFEKEKYLGQWYEIARFDFAFEQDVDNTTAEYTLRADGRINVKNRGYNYKKQQWEEANGVAVFSGADSRAALKVSFFGPFYAPYNVIALDGDYQYALVAGRNLKYLWILSRTTTIPAEIKEKYLGLASSLGYDVSTLTWVKHDR